MKKFRIYHPFYMAFYSKGLYRDVCFHWPGMGFQFLGLLVFLVSLAKGLALFSIVYAASADIKAELAVNDPVITISNGVATMKPKGPIAIQHPYFGGDFILLDPGGDTDRLGEIKQGIYLASDTLYIKLAEDRDAVEYDLSEFQDMAEGQSEIVIDRDSIESYMDVYVVFIIPVAVTFGFMILYFIYAFTMFGMGMVGVLFAKVWKADPPYTSMLRVAAISLAPAAVLDAALSISQLHMPHMELIKIVITLVYMNMAVKWCYAADEPDESGAQGDIWKKRK
jgi:hypothetical protein